MQHGITWLTESVVPTGPFAYIYQAKRLVDDFKPDWIVGFSDTYYGILAVMLGRKYGIGSVIDAYDNYESYLPWCKPLHRLWRKSIAQATLVTAAGPHLAESMALFRRDKRVYVVPMAADPNFKPLDTTECRRKLDLPIGKKLIGYSGAIHRSRGIEALFRAYEKLKLDNPMLELVLTGRKQKALSIPSGARWLGYLSDDDMPFLLNSLDLSFVANEFSDFGIFSYPVKLYEAMKCHVPVLATATPPARWILGDRSTFLFDPGNDMDIIRKTTSLLGLNRCDYGDQNTWEQSSVAFEQALLSG
jgi:glycosyltransferase involved in cell wall biosynthesis